ncbi:hypothetical protein N7491_000039 [Penicillium cf. griseofulvum]|uniref:Uncharacterized protein n=1 Tax=Penicillium cf. griseofulvum TaxID=2972120 RepID=A0A9W9MEE6_9EURO|nr:hypothetical protein N7472_004609 [Penicillium cf. griseofulvum]KAJ5450857.1 hypothetical protein N7491_000039 [Penicillium cf. griseofulvum]
MDWLQSGTVKALLHVCVESAQQTLRILSGLLEQGILDAASMSTISLLLAAAIDPSLVQDHSPWTRLAYSIFDYMSARGNPCARLLLSESKQLENELAQLASETYLTSADLPADPRDMGSLGAIIPSCVPDGSNHSTKLGLAEVGQHYELSSNQLMDLANSIDLDSLTWPSSPVVQDLEN